VYLLTGACTVAPVKTTPRVPKYRVIGLSVPIKLLDIIDAKRGYMNRSAWIINRLAPVIEAEEEQKLEPPAGGKK
jgi:hypothetical protein